MTGAFVCGRCLEELGPSYGPVLSGALFGAGWWFWIDAVATRPKEAGDVPPEHYLPGCVATLAMLMMQAVRREAIMSRGGFDTDPSDSFRARVWLFVSYLVSFSALVGSVWMLVADYADKPYPWPGIAGVLQCAFILAAGLFMWATRGGGMNGDSGMYW
ncbi:transmembrane protein 50 [Pycnococcus provasolii]